MKKYKNLIITLSMSLAYSVASNVIYFLQNHEVNFNRIQDHVVIAILIIIAYIITGMSD